MNNKIVILIGMMILGIILTVTYRVFKPDSDLNTERKETRQLSQLPLNISQDTQITVNKQGKLPELAASLRGTEIDCPLQVDANGQLLLTKGIRNCFDYFFSALGEKTESQLIVDLRQYFNATLAKTAADYAIYLLDQYVSYNHALKKLKPSGNFKSGDLESFRAVVVQMRKLQQKYFTAAEIQALFGHEQSLNQFNLEQMQIHADKTMDSQQKAIEIARLIDQLPTDLSEGVRISMQFAELQQLTQDIQQQGGSPEDIRNMRESLLGVEAADRLEKVDQEEALWQQQVNTYLTMRDQIMASSLDNSSKQQSIHKLRDDTFNTPEERLRAQSYEIIHDRKR